MRKWEIKSSSDLSKVIDLLCSSYRITMSSNMKFILSASSFPFFLPFNLYYFFINFFPQKSVEQPREWCLTHPPLSPAFPPLDSSNICKAYWFCFPMSNLCTCKTLAAPIRSLLLSTLIYESQSSFELWECICDYILIDKNNTVSCIRC